jgi:RimJ/RimL family protein N-acetyltransferase
MKSGLVVRVFSARDGRKVVFRTPRWEDLDDLLELINSLVQEKAEIIVDSKFTREQEADWLGGMLAGVERNEVVYFVAEVDGRIVASCDLHRGKGSEAHVGVVGIVVKKGFRDLGIGTEMMRAMIEQAVRWRLKLLVLSVFATNGRAIHVYEKIGFVQTGRVPMKHFREGKYVDEISMAKVLE